VTAPAVFRAASANRSGRFPVALLANGTTRSGQIAGPSETLSTTAPATTDPSMVARAAPNSNLDDGASACSNRDRATAIRSSSVGAGSSTTPQGCRSHRTPETRASGRRCRWSVELMV